MCIRDSLPAALQELVCRMDFLGKALLGQDPRRLARPVIRARVNADRKMCIRDSTYMVLGGSVADE